MLQHAESVYVTGANAIPGTLSWRLELQQIVAKTNTLTHNCSKKRKEIHDLSFEFWDQLSHLHQPWRETAGNKPEQYFTET